MMDGQATIAAEQTDLRFVLEDAVANDPDAFGYLYSITQTGPFATTALVVLGASRTRAHELAAQLNSMLSAKTPAPASVREGLTAGHSYAWRAGQAPGGAPVQQLALLVEPTPGTRQRLLADFVTEQSGAFAGAGEAARVLLLVPLLRSEARAMSCAREGPERSALHFALAKELAGALQGDPPARTGCHAGRRVFEPMQPLVGGWLFTDGNRACPPLGPLKPQLLPSAEAVVAGMAPALRATLHARFRGLFSALPSPFPPTPASRAAWVAFEGVCSGAGLRVFDETCSGTWEGGGVMMARVCAIGLALQRFFGE